MYQQGLHKNLDVLSLIYFWNKVVNIKKKSSNVICNSKQRACSSDFQHHQGDSSHYEEFTFCQLC